MFADDPHDVGLWAVASDARYAFRLRCDARLWRRVEPPRRVGVRHAPVQHQAKLSDESVAAEAGQVVD